MANGALKQMNISYHPREDRLLLKVSSADGEEFRVWLTRRFTALLLGVLGQQVSAHGGDSALGAAPAVRESFRQGAFEKPWVDAPQAVFPLGEQGILAYRITSGRGTDGTLKLQLLPEEGQGLNFSLDESMLYLLRNLLEQGLSHTGWKLIENDLHAAQLH